jgi:hypothetical protein
VLLDQAAHRTERIAMQAIEQSARRFGLLQSLPVLTILLERHLADLFQKFLLALCQKQDLVLPKVLSIS